MKDREPSFQPPAEFLENIDYAGRWVQLTFPAFGHETDEGACIGAILGSLVKERFRKTIEGYVHRTVYAIQEAVSNASDHGSKEDPKKLIKAACWYGKRGIVFGIQDEGEFYRLSHTKSAVEAGVDLPSTRENPSGAGMDIIYEAGEVFVSTEQNALFLACLVETNR